MTLEFRYITYSRKKFPIKRFRYRFNVLKYRVDINQDRDGGEQVTRNSSFFDNFSSSRVFISHDFFFFIAEIVWFRLVNDSFVCIGRLIT